jgi:predicted RNA binding protein YcfA (HicA-like mRNA interferase family)
MARPLTHKEAVTALKAFGFEKRPNKSTSHEQWVKQCPGENPAFRKVTLDKHHSPYARALLMSIIHQAGVSKKEFYGAAGVAR